MLSEKKPRASPLTRAQAARDLSPQQRGEARKPQSVGTAEAAELV
jgi:hypothetical protein